MVRLERTIRDLGGLHVANYFFDSMTQAQASTYLQAQDVIVFTTGTASQATVIFNPLTFNSSPSITVAFAGQSLTFSDDPSAIRGQTNLTLFPDSSQLFIGTIGNDVVTGTPGNDGYFGGDGNDNMNGAGGDDLLQGNQGDDTLAGGSGLNTIYG